MKFNRNKIVKLIAIKKQYKQNGKYYILPPIEDPDRGGAMVTGLEILSPEDVKELDELVLEKSKVSIPINDGQTLDLKDDFDLLTYCRCLIHNTIAGPHDARNSAHIFYMHDEEVVAKKEAAETDAVFEALNYVKDFNINEFRDLALYLGIDTSNMKDEYLPSKVRKECMSNASLIVKYKELDNRENVVFVKKLVAYRIVNNRRDGYFYDGAFLANTFDGLVMTLFKGENKGILSKLGNRLDSVLNPSHDKASDFYGDVSDKKSEKAIAAKEMEIKIKDLKYEYLKKTGTEYEGPETVKDIETALELLGNNDNEFDASKYEGKSVGELKRILNLKKVPKESFEGIEDTAQLIDLIKENSKPKK